MTAEPLRPTGLLRIVSVASVAADDVRRGQRFPLLILDTASRPDLEELLLAHEPSQPGEVDTQWATIGDALMPSAALLICRCRRPTTGTVIIEFRLPEYGRVVDFVLSAHGVWLQPGGGDHRPASQFLNRQHTFIEVDADFAAWDAMYRRLLVRELQKRGMSKDVALKLAPQLILEERQLPERR